MKPPALGVMIVIVAVLFAAALHYIASAHGAEPPRPYFCLLYDEAKRKCAFGQCDQREIWQLRKECLLDDEAERFARPNVFEFPAFSAAATKNLESR
jgi:hypothetical protein